MLLLENELSKEIKDLLKKESQLRIAVAFIGDGASQWINRQATDVKIICNLTMGGTNPAEVKKLIGNPRVDIRQIDNLHAKLYIGSEYVIVGSANMSSNGLGTQPNALREAGYKFKLDQLSGRRSLDWFDNDLWESARPITNQDLEEAAEKWRRRDRVRDGGQLVAEIPQQLSPQQLSKFWEENPTNTDYIFSFYYESRADLSEEDEKRIKENHGDEIYYFEEGCHDNENDANSERDKIYNQLGLKSGAKLEFCIRKVQTRLPRTGKFKIDGSFVARIKDVIVFKNDSGGFEVISLYEECKNRQVVIDENFTKFLSSAYLNQVLYPNFNNFVNRTLDQQNNYCTYNELKNAL